MTVDKTNVCFLVYVRESCYLQTNDCFISSSLMCRWILFPEYDFDLCVQPSGWHSPSMPLAAAPPTVCRVTQGSVMLHFTYLFYKNICRTVCWRGCRQVRGGTSQQLVCGFEKEHFLPPTFARSLPSVSTPELLTTTSLPPSSGRDVCRDQTHGF